MSSFSGQNVNKGDWTPNILDSEQGTLKEGTNEGSLQEMLAQGKGRAKLNHKPKVNGSVARIIAKKYTKQRLFKKPKAKRAQQTEQAGLRPRLVEPILLHLSRLNSRGSNNSDT